MSATKQAVIALATGMYYQDQMRLHSDTRLPWETAPPDMHIEYTRRAQGLLADAIGETRCAQ